MKIASSEWNSSADSRSINSTCHKLFSNVLFYRQQVIMLDFAFNGLPSRVVFGAGSLSCLDRELDALRIGRALVLSTAQQEKLARRIAESLGVRSAGVYPRAVMHVPIETARAASEDA